MHRKSLSHAYNASTDGSLVSSLHSSGALSLLQQHLVAIALFWRRGILLTVNVFSKVFQEKLLRYWSVYKNSSYQCNSALWYLINDEAVDVSMRLIWWYIFNLTQRWLCLIWLQVWMSLIEEKCHPGKKNFDLFAIVRDRKTHMKVI